MALRRFYMRFIQRYPRAIFLFLREVRVEMKKVNWLSRSEVIRYTLLVFGFSFVAAIYLGAVDFLFAWMLGQFIL